MYYCSAGEQYLFNVSARNLVGYSPTSEISIISATYPSVPLNVMQSLEAVSKTNVTITWDTPVSDGGSSIIEYKVIFRPEADPNTSFYGFSTTNNFTQTNLTEGTEFFVTVQANNIIGHGVGNVEVIALVGA
jgi:hypothetical protein